MSAIPSHALEARLAALVPRLRAVRVIRGVCACVLAGLALTAFALALDAAFTLSAPARGLFLAVWCTTLGVLVWRWILRPWQEEITLADVSLEIQKSLPELGERLHAVVRTDRSTKSETVHAALVEDAERRSRAVDLSHAVSLRTVSRVAAGTACALVVCAAVFATMPGSTERVRRVAMPWIRPPVPGFRVIVTSGEPTAKRGSTITLAAYAEKFDTRTADPATATCVIRDRSTIEHRYPMTRDDAGAFHFSRTEANADFDYRVEIDSVASDWFRVTVLDAVEIGETTAMEIVPPAYTQTAKRKIAGFADCEVLQYTTLNLHWKFTQPAASARLEWQPANEPKAESLALELAADQQSGTATLRANTTGVLRLQVVREEKGKRLRSQYSATIRVVPDRAPVFEEIAGVTTRPRTVLPGMRVPIAFVARDDLQLARAELQFFVGNDETKVTAIAIPLTGQGTPRATGQFDFDLATHVKKADTIRFRVAVWDHLQIAGDKPVGAQAAFYPATGWSELRIAATAPPLAEQDVLCHRDALHDSLNSVLQSVTASLAELQTLSAETTGVSALEVDQIVRLNRLRERVRTARATADELASDIALTLALRPVAGEVRALATHALKPAAESLANADEAKNSDRATALAASEKSLAAARDTLAALIGINEVIARERLDILRLETLASEQLALTKPADANPQDLLAKQRELLARFQALIADSEPLRQAIRSAKGAETRRFATACAELATAMRELDAAIRRTTTEARTTLVADIARDQDTLTKQAAKLFVSLELAARLAGVAPPKLEDFRRAIELAANGNTVDSLSELEKHTQSLERIAIEFDRWENERTDLKRAAKQLALWQDDLLTRFRSATKLATFDKLPVPIQTAFRDEQQAVLVALGQLSLPHDAAVKTAIVNVLMHAELASKFLAGDGVGAETAMDATAKAIARFSVTIPPIPERLARTRTEFDKFRLDYDPVATLAEQTARSYENQLPTPVIVAAITRKLAPTVERFQKLQSSVAAWDLPGFEVRKARLLAAITTAIADLQTGASYDLLASQAALRREVERMKLALDGLPTPETKTLELTRKLAIATDAIEALGANITAKTLEPLLPALQDANKQLAALSVPESPALVNDAKTALQSAEAGFRDGAKPDEVRRRIRFAVDSLHKLAQRLNGQETDLERVQRLAFNRRIAWQRAKDLIEAKSPTNVGVADETLRQLLRELEELQYTRVGVAGQVAKKRVTDSYLRLRAKLEPERAVLDQRLLAESLDELAARMADIAEFAVGESQVTPEPAVAVADRFLPSRLFADNVRELVKSQRVLHARLTNLARDIANRLRPAPVNPLPAIIAAQQKLATATQTLPAVAANTAIHLQAAIHAIQAGDIRAAHDAATTAWKHLESHIPAVGKPAEDLAKEQQQILAELTAIRDSSNVCVTQQLARAQELATRATELSRVLQLAANGLEPTDETAQTYAEVAMQLQHASKQLQLLAKPATGETAKQREELVTLFTDSQTQLASKVIAPVGGALAAGESLRRAELAMRRAMAELATAATAEPAVAAMREAATSLTASAKSTRKLLDKPR